MNTSHARHWLAGVLLACGLAPCQAASGQPWHFELKNDTSCDFTLTHQTHDARQHFKGTFEPCDPVLDISHHVLSRHMAIVDAPVERGGSAYVFHATGSAIHHLKLHYLGADEDALAFALKGNTLKLATSREVIYLHILKNGQIKLNHRIRRR